jgi:HD-GYP domain-containing protein (c-di-GMP phosphodiesterase class II)
VGIDLDAGRGKWRYDDELSLNAEVPAARAAQQDAIRIVGELVVALRAGRAPSAAQVHAAVAPIVASVLRNADAFFWVTSTLRRDPYLLSHAVNCSAMAAALGRHLGFEPALLHSLATGGLLLDIGKAQLSDAVLDAPGPPGPELGMEFQQHARASLQVAEQAGIDDPVVRDMLLHHHERWDGNGYPERLKAGAIPPAARLAAVIDAFDAMTSERAYQSPTSRHQALQELYRGHGTRYELDAVEQFLQCMSIYPTGSLVELNTGEVGIVVAQNRARRLHPRVMLLLDAGKAAYARYPVIDLVAHNEANPEAAVDIAEVPEPGAFGLDLAALYLA